MSHARIYMPDEDLVVGDGAGMANGAPAGRAMPTPALQGGAVQAVMGGASAPAPTGVNDVTNPDMQQTARLFVEFNTSAEGLMSPVNKHMRIFDVGANATNIFSLPKGCDPNVLKSAVMLDWTLVQTSNSFPYAVSLQLEGPGAAPLNTQGRASGTRVAVTMSPGEIVRCNQQLYQPDPVIRGAHFRDYAHCKFLNPNPKTHS